MRTTLTLDDDRRHINVEFRTRDGLLVTVTTTPDQHGDASAPGTSLAHLGGSTCALLERDCPGICDTVQEPYERPLREQSAFSRQLSKPSLNDAVLRKLLSGEQTARIPRYKLARMQSDWAQFRDAAEQYYLMHCGGLLEVTVRVCDQSELVVVIRTLSGIDDCASAMIRTFVKSVIDEARGERE